ncbi:MAG: hypothetical protein MUF64_04615 [Polyangiaceae bacterium]|jgi:hypothetical protein|nr:hypothetical protein [Polyangiaceae bacterium]
MLIDPKDALRSAARYLQQNPEVFRKVVHNVRDYKLTIPLDVLRYVARKAEGKKNAPRDVTVEATPPGLALSGRVSVMGATLRFSASINIDEVSVSQEELRFQVRLSGVKLEAEGDGSSPVAALIKSGVLDLSKPGNIARYMPNRPAFIVEAEDDRVLLDLMRDEKLTSNPRFARAMSLITPVVGLRRIHTEHDAMVLELLPRREGITELVSRARAAMRDMIS